MKKRGLFAILFGMAVLSFGLFNSCDIDIGLGSAVDTEPPKVTIENPPASKIIRDAFPICGTFSDDGSISAITVVLTNTETQQEYPKIDGTWGKENTWSAVVDPVKSKIPDGKYEAKITISDNGGHHSVSTRSFVIDNTAPVVILSRPASAENELDTNKIESYGQYITLEGQAADDNEIEKIVIKFYSKAEPDKAPIVKEITSIPPTISLDVAKFMDENDSTYTDLYGEAKDAGEKEYYCTISAFDGAKRYPAKGDEKADDDYGNEESTYILWTDWEKFQKDYSNTTGSTSKIKVPDLYSIKAGKSTGTQERSVSEKTLISDFFHKAISRGIFKLNPLNNPSYSISGLDIGVANDVENERSLTIQLSKGLDGISLDTDNMKVYLIPITIEDDGTETRGNKIYPQQSKYERKGDGQFLTVIQKDNVKDADGKDTSLVYGTTYVIGVDGADTENNKIVPSFDGKEFFIRFKAKNVAPGLTIDEPLASTSYLKKGDTLLIKGTTSVPDGYPTVSITCKKGDDTTAIPVYTHKVKDSDKQKIEGGLIYYNWEFEVPTSGTADEFFFDQGDPDSEEDASDQYVFDITSDLDSMPTSRTKTIIYDLYGPTISIDTMLPTAEKYNALGDKQAGDYLNGDVTMKVSILDDYDSVNTDIKDSNNDKRPYFIITEENGTEIPFRVGTESVKSIKHYITTPAKQQFKIKTEDIASGTDVKNIKVKIFAEDRAGNKGVDIDDRTKKYYERSYTVDQSTDIPWILPKNSATTDLSYTKEQAQDLSNTEVNVYFANQTVMYKMIDDDGLAYAKYQVTKVTDDSEVKAGTIDTKGASEYQLEVTMPDVPGTYKVYLETKDTNTLVDTGSEPKTTSKSFYIRVTAAAPTIQEITLLSTIFKGSDLITPTIKISSDQVPFVLQRIVKDANGNEITALSKTIDKNEKSVLETESPEVVDSILISDGISSTSTYKSGNYTIYYKVKDKNSRWSDEYKKNFTVDLIPPVISEVKVADVLYNPATWNNSKTLALQVHASDSHISTVEYSLNNSVYTALSHEDAASAYTGTAVFNAEGAVNKLYIRVKDTAGNITYFDGTTADGIQTLSYVNVKIDTSAPNLSALYFQKGTETPVAKENSIYVKENTKLTVYGNYDDSLSGAGELSLTLPAIEETSPTVKYSTTAIGTTASTIPAASEYKLYSEIADKASIKSWKAEFTPKASGEFYIQGSDLVSTETKNTTAKNKVFDINYDKDNPEFEISLFKGSDGKEVYQNPANYKYYVNNTNKTFELTGTSSDNIGVETVTLTITKNGTTTKLTPGRAGDSTLGRWKFTGIDMQNWDGTGATAEITVTDKAGNKAASTLDIVFDVTKPESTHGNDDAGKDLYFRIGDFKNDGGDLDVGGKYSAGTFANSTSMLVRGEFADEANGSGINQYYYKVYSDLATITAKTDDELITDVVTDNAKGVFKPLSSEETRRVDFNVKSANKATWDAIIADTENNAEQVAYIGPKTGTEYYQYRRNIVSNYKTTISSLSAGSNYVVIVAEDNAGNRSVDKIIYSLNVDMTVPKITTVAGDSTTKSTDVTLTVTMEEEHPDSPEVVIKKDGTAILQKAIVGAPVASGTAYTSSVTIPFSSTSILDGTYTIEVRAKDKAKNLSDPVTKTIIKDTTKPVIEITKPAGESSTYIKDNNYKFEGKITELNEISAATATLYKDGESTAKQTTTLTPKRTNGSDTEWTWAWQVYGLEASDYYVVITAQDIAGNSAESKTSETIKLDNTAPTVKVTATGLKDTDYKTPETLTSKATYYAGNSYEITVTVDDVNFDYDDEISVSENTKEKLYNVTSKKGTTANTDFSVSKVSAKSFKITPTYNSTDINGDGTYEFTISVKDKAGNASDSVIIKVQRDITQPVVKIESPSATSGIIKGASYSFRISAKDGTGVGVANLAYAFSQNENEDALVWQSEEFTDGEKIIEMPLKEGRTLATDETGKKLCEGNWYLYAKSADKSGNSTTTLVKRAFTIDLNNPELSVTGLEEGKTNIISDEVGKNGYKLNVNVSDTNALAASDALVITVDGEDLIKTNGEWIITKGKDKGNLNENTSVTVELTATDIVGNKTSKTYYIYNDIAAPALEVVAPVETEAVGSKDSSSITIKGTASDDGYGVEKVEYALYRGLVDETTQNPILVTSNNKDVTSNNYPLEKTGEQWKIQASTGMPLGDVEGQLTLAVKATEKKNGEHGGRTTTVYRTFYYDKANPNLTETTIGTVGKTTNDTFKLEGKIWDSNAIGRIEITDGTTTWKSTDTSPIITIEGTTTLDSEPASNNWSATFEKGLIGDGTKEFTITAYDASGKTKQLTRTVVLDTQKPEVEAPAITQTATKGWYNTRTISISGKVTDSSPSSGIKTVEWASSNATNATWSPLSVSANKNAAGKVVDYTYSGSVAFDTDGTQTLYIRAIDTAENNSDNQNKGSFSIDTEAPDAPVFLGAGPSGSIASANDITSLLVNPTLNKPVIVYAALKEGGSALAKSGIADADAFIQKGKTGTAEKITNLATITSFTKDWAKNTEYSEGNVVKNNSKLYMCKTVHTSASSFETTNWTELTETEYEFWSYTIPSTTTDMVNGGINFTVKDKAGNTADYTLFQMTVDTRAPTVTADALTDADTEAEEKQINGKITISGIASDENGLSTTETIKLYYTTNSTFASATTPDVSKWTKIAETTPTADNTWSFTNINTSKLDGTTAIANQTTVYFLVSVQDKAGNIGYSARDAKLTAIVDQDSDRPVIKFTNLKFDTKDTSKPAMAADKLVPFEQTDLYGSITDDDGISTVHYIMSSDSDPAEDATGWQPLTIENGSFSLNFDAADGDAGDGDGTKKIYFKIVDTANNTFISSATDSFNLKSPKLKDNSATAVKYGYRSSTTGYKQTVAYLKVDNHAPFEGSLQFTTKSASTDTPTAADWKSKSEISSMPFGGPNERKTFKIRIPAWDANNVQTVTMVLPGYDGDKTKEGENPITFTNTGTNAGVSTSPKATWWISPEIDVSALETGNKNCSITVSDGVKTSSDDFVIAIDNTVPVISASNPSSSQYSSGNIIAYGETDLTYWKNTSTTDQPREFMYYALSLDDSTIPADDFEATSETTASIITKWKDENGEEITSENTPAGAKVTLAYKPYYTPIKGGSFNWYVYFDDGISTENDSHDVSFKQFLINSGVTTQEAIETTDQDNKFRTKVQAYLWIKAVDQVGNNSVIKHPILIDPQGDAPSVTIDYPEADGTTLGGKVTLRGTAKDEKGNNPGVESVWVQIISAKENGYISSNENQTLGKENTSTAASGLKFADTVTDTETEEGNHSYSHSYNVTYFKPTMKDVKQWINAKDSSNNAIYEVYTKITDATPTRVSTVGTGDAWADTANGSAYYIKAKFSGSAWSLDINKNAEFNPDAGKLNPIAYRVFAKDKDKNLSSYEQQLGVFDSDNPILGTLYLRQYSDNEHGSGTIIASRPYEDNMWINGTWWLYGTVTDSDEFSVLTVNEVNQTTNGQTGTINYKINTENEVDTFELEIVASDNASTAHTTRKTCVINYDKKDPELAPKVSTDYKISSTVQNSNGFYTFGSQVTENVESGKAQSGFDYLAFWFEREITGTGGKHVVFDVMRPKTTTNGVTANTSEVEWSDLATFTTESDAKGLKWKNISATRSSTDLGKLTIDSEDKNIHVGGICMIRGSIYFIASVEKNTTTNKWEIGINGQPEYTTESEDVYFAIANIVNNNVESADGNNKSAVDGMYGYYSSISNDDGDHMLESVKEQGTAWTWQANINSQNMGDGDVKLHYVAFDKAGNFKEGIEECKVANNAPRLASVTVWSDFNDNDDRDEGEYETMYYQGKERKLSSGYVQRATALNPTDKVFVVSGNNKDFNDNGSAFMTVKDKTRFIPEIIGGNGDLYYSYKYGKSSAFVADAAETKLLTAHVGEKIGVGADHGIDEDIDSNGYYKEDLNNSGYIEGRTDLWEGTNVTEENQKFMEIPGTGTFSLQSLGNSSTTDPMWFEYTIYDSTLGCADWNDTTLTTTGRLSSTFRVALAIKYTDETDPVVKIRPFYWNSSTAGQNSISWNADSKPEGHIELEGDLTPAIKNATAGTTKLGDDPKVSGKIIVEGYAFDDIRLNELWVQFASHSSIGTAKKAASYDGDWNDAHSYSDSDGWGFEATDVFCNGDGHLVSWKLTLDTSKITGSAGIDKNIIVYAKDKRGDRQSSSAASSQTSIVQSYTWSEVKSQKGAQYLYFTDFNCTSPVVLSGEGATADNVTVYKGPTRWANVKAHLNSSDKDIKALVFYEDFFCTRKATAQTSDDTLVYPAPVSYKWSDVKTETNAASLYFTDFYCSTPVVTVATETTPVTPDNTTVFKSSLSHSYKVDVVPYITGVKSRLAKMNTPDPTIYSRTAQGHYPIASNEDSIEFEGFNLGTDSTLDSDAIGDLESGEYSYKVGNVPALNNINNNEACGTYVSSTSEKTNVSNMYNRQPNTSTNLKLTDNVYFDVWEFTTGAVGRNGKIKEPIMRINPDNNIIGMAFASGPSHFSMPNTTNSYEIWQRNYADYNGIAMAYDYQGRAHTISIGLDTSPNDNPPLAGRMNYNNSGFGHKQGNTDYASQGYANFTKRTQVALESLGQTMDTERFSDVSIAVASKSTGDPRVYIAYCDTASNQIRFRYGTIDNFTRYANGTYEQYDQISDDKNATYTNNNGVIYDDGTNQTYSNHRWFDAHTDNYSLIAGGSTGNATGEYVSLDAIAGNGVDTDVVLVVWADDSHLYYTYRHGTKDDKDASSGGVANKWAKPAVIATGAVQYCKVKADVTGGVHIAWFNRNTSDLQYAYMTGYNSAYGASGDFDSSKLYIATVDSYSQVGSYLDIDVGRKTADGNVIPYISYYADGMNSLPKVAYLTTGIDRTSPVIPNGADTSTNLFTGDWEVSLMPTSSLVRDDNINVALWKDKETGVINKTPAVIGNITAAAATNATSTVLPNKKSEVAIGYAIVKDAIGYIEIAQRK